MCKRILPQSPQRRHKELKEEQKPGYELNSDSTTSIDNNLFFSLMIFVNSLCSLWLIFFCGLIASGIIQVMKQNHNESYLKFRKKILNDEKNGVTLPREGVLSVALVFPNSYAVGMANLGFQTVYKLFNEFPGVRCERSFHYQKFPTVTKTLESSQELREFDVIAFSVSFEMDYTNVIQILINAGITPLSSKRDFREPLIIAGGAVTFINPTQLAPFVDIFVIGELEPKLNTLLGSLLSSKSQKLPKKEILDSFNSFPDFYVPEKYDVKQKVQKVRSYQKIQQPQYSPILSPHGHFKNMFLTEVGRGCGRRCNFCAASFIYYPFRVFPVQNILETIGNFCQGTKRIGLIGSAISDYPGIKDLCEQLVNQGYELGLSSFRLDKITPSFLKVLERGKVKTVTFAVEAGTERLRRLIHKNLSEKQVFDAAGVISKSTTQQVKLYFLIGLPGETWEDIKGIIFLVEKMHRVFAKSKRQKKMTVSVNTFIPKPFTPFQWAPMEKMDAIQVKRKYLTNELKNLPGVQISPKSAKQEILQGIFSLGEQNVGLAIYHKIVDKSDWEQAMLKAGVDKEALLYSPKKYDDVLAWDFIESGVKKEKLWKIWEMTEDCANELIEKL